MLICPTMNAPDYSRLNETIFRHSSIRELTVLLVGAGALGNEVAKLLGLLGVGRLAVVDPDQIQASDLTRSILFRGSNVIGQNKALAAAGIINELFPDTECIGLSQEIADVGFQDVAKCRTIFSCVDSDLARLEIAYVATRLDIPVSDGGLGGSDYWRGRATYFPGRKSACYGCLLSDQRRRELLTLGDSSVRSCWRESGGARGQPIPSTPTMASIIAALQVEIGLRKLLEPAKTGSGTTSVELSLSPLPELESLEALPSKTCPFHRENASLVFAPCPSLEATVADLFDSVSSRTSQATALLLDWPLCTRARCTQCGFKWSPMRRLAFLRRSGTCPQCASRGIVEEEIIRSIERKSTWLGYTMEQLGQPENHLYSVLLGGNEC